MFALVLVSSCFHPTKLPWITRQEWENRFIGKATTQAGGGEGKALMKMREEEREGSFEVRQKAEAGRRVKLNLSKRFLVSPHTHTQSRSCRKLLHTNKTSRYQSKGAHWAEIGMMDEWGVCCVSYSGDGRVRGFTSRGLLFPHILVFVKEILKTKMYNL